MDGAVAARRSFLFLQGMATRFFARLGSNLFHFIVGLHADFGGLLCDVLQSLATGIGTEKKNSYQSQWSAEKSESHAAFLTERNNCIFCLANLLAMLLPA